MANLRLTRNRMHDLRFVQALVRQPLHKWFQFGLKAVTADLRTPSDRLRDLRFVEA
eukprot:CAMPEP_0204246264 /NCGR_PEP_ID=MMETSP0361-20130328/98052_1 /ASSEMBLY_ACC=CAM_ASM_000343 /TAXON_ID=268821 /ORGANISM="Scrippsiella Hangoei, Strain SHTV-5" /LENGTH=55 /DNA_ID=CAMNT_0051219481 /DNA_START=173 /DNA_END=340 /DNA_ORIENTATION=+